MTTLIAAPADTGTRLAVDRTRLAYERTMMAWVRTAASMISFGFTIHKFFQFQAPAAALPAGTLLGPGRFGGLLVVTGLVALAVASIDHRRSLNLTAGGIWPPAILGGRGDWYRDGRDRRVRPRRDVVRIVIVPT